MEPPEPTEPTQSTQSSTDRRLEIVAALILGFTALATAWSGYQASLWGGIQSSNYTQASGSRTNAAQARNDANQYRLADLSVFESYVDAAIDGDEELADFYRVRFRDDFVPAFEAWIALDPLNIAAAPSSPLGMEEYELPQDQEAAALEARADALFEEGEEANAHSDTYTLTTVLFAATLFFAAISERFEYVRVRKFLLGLAAVGFFGGLVVALRLPITFG